MELQFLYGLQELHGPVLDKIMIGITKLGDGGIFWLALALVLLVIPKTRKCGISIFAAMAFSYIIGNLGLKPLVARPRPFTVATDVALIIDKPGEFSFPSGHTLHAFTAATAIFCYYRKPGVAAYVLAALIAFSRMYLFVHYPTDILAGAVLGILDALLISCLLNKYVSKMKKEK